LKLSVLITTYNQDGYIRQCIESIFENLENLDFEYEVIVGNDKSLDATESILKDMQSNMSFKRLKVINYKENVGGLKNINYLINKSIGEYLLIIEGDDYYKKSNYIRDSIEYLDKNINVGYVTSGSLIDKNNTLSSNPLNFKHDFVLKFSHIAMGNFIQMGTILFRRLLFDKLPDYFYDLYLGDWPLLLTLSCTSPGYYFNKASFVYRLHDQGVWSKASQVEQLTKTIITTKIIITKSGFPRNYIKFLRYYLCYLITKKFLYKKISNMSEQEVITNDLIETKPMLIKTNVKFAYYLVKYFLYRLKLVLNL